MTAQRSDLYFDGGDFAADSETVFVCPNVVKGNLQQTMATRTYAELLDQLAMLLDAAWCCLMRRPNIMSPCT